MSVKVPLFLTPVNAGFPSPAEDEIETHLDLNELIVKHPASTFMVRVKGESMKDLNIFDGDILVADRSLDPKNKSVVIANVNGAFTVKSVVKLPGGLFLKPANSNFAPIKINIDDEFQIFGVVTYIIRKVKPYE